MKMLKIVAVAFLCVSTTGCVSLSGHPNRTEDISSRKEMLRVRYFDLENKTDAPPNQDSVQEDSLQPMLTESILMNYMNGLYDNNAKKKRSSRDEIVYGRMELYDLNYFTFRKMVYKEGTTSNVALDILGVGVGAAGAAVTGADGSRILSAISGGLSGTRTSINKNLYFERTLPAILVQMDANRDTIRAEIYESLQGADVDAYPLGRAVVELERYFTAGTIPGAIEAIVKQAGVAKQKAEEKLEGVKEWILEDVDFAIDVMRLARNLRDGEALKLMTNPPSPIDDDAKTMAVNVVSGATVWKGPANSVLTKLGEASEDEARRVLEIVIGKLEDKSNRVLELWKAAMTPLQN